MYLGGFSFSQISGDIYEHLPIFMYKVWCDSEFLISEQISEIYLRNRKYVIFCFWAFRLKTKKEDFFSLLEKLLESGSLLWRFYFHPLLCQLWTREGYRPHENCLLCFMKEKMCFILVRFGTSVSVCASVLVLFWLDNKISSVRLTQNLMLTV